MLLGTLDIRIGRQFDTIYLCIFLLAFFLFLFFFSHRIHTVRTFSGQRLGRSAANAIRPLQEDIFLYICIRPVGIGLLACCCYDDHRFIGNRIDLIARSTILRTFFLIKSLPRVSRYFKMIFKQKFQNLPNTLRI